MSLSTASRRVDAIVGFASNRTRESFTSVVNLFGARYLGTLGIYGRAEEEGVERSALMWFKG